MQVADSAYPCAVAVSPTLHGSCDHGRERNTLEKLTTAVDFI